MPEARRVDGSGLRFGVSDNSGHFAIKDLPPGKYRVFAFTSPDPAAMLNPAVAEALAPLGTDVELKDHEHGEVSLNVIGISEAVAIIGRNR